MSMLHNNAKWLFAVMCMLALAGCSREPEQREAFIGFLQTRAINAKGAIVPYMNQKEEQAIGSNYVAQYQVILDFDKAMNKLVDGPYKETQALISSARSPADILKRRDDIVKIKTMMDTLGATIRQELDKSNAARAALTQPDDLKPVYDQAYAKIVSAPAEGFLALMPPLQEALDAMLKLADFLQNHSDKISIEEGQLMAGDQTTLDALQPYLDDLNEKSAVMMKAQQQLMNTIQGK